jgi:small ligand-binding sensory domain FIST
MPSLLSGNGSADAGGWLSVLAGVVPGVERVALRVEDMRVTRKLPDLGAVPAGAQHWLLLSDPRSVDTEALLRQLDAHAGGASIVGALAGNVAAPEHTALLLDGEVYADGAVALGFSGSLALCSELICACRPIGEPLIVLEAVDNVITRFDRGPAGQTVRQLVESLSEADRRSVATSLCLGMQPLDRSQVVGGTDFVMRSLLSVNSQGVAVVDTPHRLQVVQFHLRDDDHYRRELRARAARACAPSPSGALLFVNAGLPIQSAGEIATGSEAVGLRSHGEIAPLAGKARLHGLSSVLARFDSTAPAQTPNTRCNTRSSSA